LNITLTVAATLFVMAFSRLFLNRKKHHHHVDVASS